MSRAPSEQQDALVRKRLIGLALVVLLGAGGLWYIFGRDSGVISGEILTEARFPAALTVLPDGTIRYGERLTGLVREIAPSGDLAPDALAQVDVSFDGHRGLLGIAVDDRDRTFVSWTRGDDRLVVAQVAPGEQRLVWEGPPTPGRNIGGHIEFDPAGRLVIGIGDLEDPDAVVDPSLPNGKMLALDADAPPTQEPETISGGWNNPFAFAYSDEGVLWIADNSSDDAPERLTRGDLDARRYPITELPQGTVPTGLAATEDDVYVCGFESRRLLRYRVRGDEAIRRGKPLATNCSLEVAVHPDGHLLYSNEGTIFTLPARGRP